MHTPRCIPPRNVLSVFLVSRAIQIPFASGGSLATPTSLKLQVKRPCLLAITTEAASTVVLYMNGAERYQCLPAGGGRILVNEDCERAAIVATTIGWASIEEVETLRNEGDPL